MIINTGAGGASTAEAVQYDNKESGLEATNVQGAVDELNDSLQDISKNIYSTEEQKVGTFLGKDLYGILFSGTISDSEIEIDISSLNVKNVVSYKGTILKQASSGYVANPIPSYFDSSNYIIPYVAFSTNSLHLRSAMKGDYTLIMEYTKNT